MAKHLTLEGLEEAIRNRSSTITLEDLRACLRAYGFEPPNEHNGGSHEHWVHRGSGASAGLVYKGHKADQDFNKLKDIRDALIQARDWEAAQNTVTYILPDCITTEMLAKDRVSFIQSAEDPSLAILSVPEFPELARAIPISELDIGRYMREVKALHGAVEVWKQTLAELGEAGIIRIPGDDTNTPLLKVNESGGFPLPLLGSGEDAITLNTTLENARNAVITEATALAAQAQEQHSEADRLVQEAEKTLTHMGCRVEEREGVRVAVVPTHLAKHAGINSGCIPLRPNASLPVAKTIKAKTTALRADLDMLTKAQNEKLAVLTTQGYTCERHEDGAVFITNPSGTTRRFEADGAGLVDFPALRAFVHSELGDRVARERTVTLAAERAQPPLREGGRAL